MTLLKRPWFIILLIVGGIYTYQFYNRVEVSTSQAGAVSQIQDSDEAAEKPPVSVKISQEFPAARSVNFELSSYYQMSVKFSKTDGDKVIISLIGDGEGYSNDGQRLADWFQVSSAGKTLKLHSFDRKGYRKITSMKELAKSFKGQDTETNFTMIVEYPEDFEFNNIQLDAVTTDVFANELAFKKFKMATVSGDLRLKNSKGSTLKIESVSGDTNVEVSGLKKVEVASVSGDAVIMSDQSNPDVKYESVSGDLKLRIPEDSQVDVSFNSMTGDLINDFSNSPSASKKLKFSSLSGSATIHKMK